MTSVSGFSFGVRRIAALATMMFVVGGVVMVSPGVASADAPFDALTVAFSGPANQVLDGTPATVSMTISNSSTEAVDFTMAGTSDQGGPAPITAISSDCTSQTLADQSSTFACGPLTVAGGGSIVESVTYDTTGTAVWGGIPISLYVVRTDGSFPFNPTYFLPVRALDITLSAPATVIEGQPLVVQSTLTNTVNQLIGGVDFTGSADHGWIIQDYGSVYCGPYQNNGSTSATGSSSWECPPYGLPVPNTIGPLATISHDTKLDTTGLGGQTITLTDAVSTGLGFGPTGGEQETVTRTVQVLPAAQVSFVPDSPSVEQGTPLPIKIYLDNPESIAVDAVITVTTDRGWLSPTSVPQCSEVNSGVTSATGHATLTCPDPAKSAGTLYPPGTTLLGTATLNTTGLGGRTVTLTGAMAAADGSTSSVSTTVDVTGVASQPTITITAPSAGPIAGPTATLFTADATPSAGATIASVEFGFDDTNVIGYDTSPTGTTYTAIIPPGTMSPGDHTLYARAYDSFGNVGEDTVVVTVPDPAPTTITITSPSDGATLSNSAPTLFSADVTAPADAPKIDHVWFVVDGENVVYQDFAAPYHTLIPPNSLNSPWAPGPDHGVEVLADHATDTLVAFASITVYVPDPPASPSVAFVAPAANTTLDDSAATVVSASAGADPNLSVASVQFVLDPGPGQSVLGTDAVAQAGLYQTSIGPNSLTPGPHTLRATVTDSLGATTSVDESVTEPVPPVGTPTLVIHAPASFDPTFDSGPTTYTVTVAHLPSNEQKGSATQWSLDGVPLAKTGNSTSLDWSALPADIVKPGEHTLTATADAIVKGTTTHRRGSATLKIVVEQATLQFGDGSDTIYPLSGDFVPGGATDAGWSVPVTNTSSFTAHHVTVTLSSSHPFDLPSMLQAPPVDCSGSGGNVVCDLGSIAPGVTVDVPALISAELSAAGDSLSGTASLSATNVAGPLSTPVDLAATTAIYVPPPIAEAHVPIAAQLAIGVASPASAATSVVSNSTATDPTLTNQVLMHVAIPRMVTNPATLSLAKRFAAVEPFAFPMALSKTVPPPAVSVALLPADNQCADCVGLAAFIGGDFSHFSDASNPIKITLSTFLQISATGCKGAVCPGAKHLHFQGTGAEVDLDSRPLCGKVKPYPTPCKYATKYKVVKATATTPAGVVATDVVLFTGDDPGLRRW